MTKQSQLLRFGGRALTAAVLCAIGVSGALFISQQHLPSRTRAPHAIAVEAQQQDARTVVCSGAFAELGADPEQPAAAIPTGEATIITSDNSVPVRQGDASVITGSATTPLAAAQMQNLQTEQLRGLTASTCVEASNDQWLIGGDTTIAFNTTITLTNPTAVAATAQITIYSVLPTGGDAIGNTAHSAPGAQLATSVIVQPQSNRTVSLNGLAPDSSALAAHVISTGAPLAATLGVAQQDGIYPVGAATVNRQIHPAATQILPGLLNAVHHDHAEAPGDAHETDQFPVRIVTMLPGSEAAEAELFALTAEGESVSLGTMHLQPGQLHSFDVKQWPEHALTLKIVATQPIFAAARGAISAEQQRDIAWVTPAPPLRANVQQAVAVVPDAQLLLVNDGAQSATVSLSADSTAQQLTIAPGTAQKVPLSGGYELFTTAPLNAAVLLAGEGTYATYPVLELAKRGGALTVYTR